jgi:hypothetical protein
MAGNHVEAHPSLPATGSIGRCKTSLIKTPRLVPTPKRRRNAFPFSVCAKTQFFIFLVENAKGREKPKQFLEKRTIPSPNSLCRLIRRQLGLER